MKRVLRFLGLAALCGLGLNALAAGNAAKIGDTEYATIEEAHANVPDGGTIELIANAVLTQEIDNKTASGVSMHACKFTVDLKGYTLTMNSGIYTFYDITFKNGTIKISDPSGAEMGTPWTKVFYVEGNAKIAPVTLTFDHVKFVCEQATVTALIETSGTNAVNKPTVRFNECELDLASCGKPVNLGGSWPTVEFINSTIVAKDVSASGLVFGDNPHGLAKFSGGEVHMTDYGRLAANCQLEIENCVVTATGLKKELVNNCAVTLKNGAKVDISASPSVKKAIDVSGLVAEAGCELKIAGVSTDGVFLNKASSVAVGAEVSIDCPITASAALQIAAGAYSSVAASGASAAVDLTGGIYKEKPDDAFVNPAYKAQANTDETTKAQGYLYMVAPPPPVAEIFVNGESKGTYTTVKKAVEDAGALSMTESDPVIVQLSPGVVQDGNLVFSNITCDDMVIQGADGETPSEIKDCTITVQGGNNGSNAMKNLTIRKIFWNNSGMTFSSNSSFENLVCDGNVFRNVDRSDYGLLFNSRCVGFTYANNRFENLEGENVAAVNASGTQLTGDVLITNNVVKGCTYRAFQITFNGNDGVADRFTITDNWWLDNAGNAQISSSTSGSDSVSVVANYNVFNGKAEALQFTVYNNPPGTEVKLDHNYFTVSPDTHPGRFYVNGNGTPETIASFGVYPYYNAYDKEALEAGTKTVRESLYNLVGREVAEVISADGTVTNGYDTLALACSNAKASETVRLLKDVTYEGALDINKAITLDLNGKKFGPTDSVGVDGSSGTSVTIKNGTLDFTGATGENYRKNVPGGAVLAILGSQTLTLDGVTVVAKDVPGVRYPVFVGKGSLLAANNCDFAFENATCGFNQAGGSPSATFTGCTITFKDMIRGGSTVLSAFTDQDGKAANCTYAFVDSEVTIDDAQHGFSHIQNLILDNSTVTINDVGFFGIYDCGSVQLLNDAKLQVKCGTYDFDPSAYVMEGYAAFADVYIAGTWTVGPAAAQAFRFTTGSNKGTMCVYDAGNGAIDAAQSGETVVLVSGMATAEKTLNRGEKLTLVYKNDAAYDYTSLVHAVNPCKIVATVDEAAGKVVLSAELDGGKCPVVIYDAEGNPTYYATFAEAVDAAKSGGMISVNREIEETEPIEIANKSVTLDLAGQLVNAGISFTGTAEDFIIDSVGGGKVLGEIKVLGENCTLKIRAGTYAFDPSVAPTKWLDPAVDETGRALYVVIPQEDESGRPFYKVMPNQVEVKTPDPKEVVATDANGDPIPASEQAEAAEAIVKANDEVKQTIEQNSSIDTGIESAAKEPVKTPSGEIVPGPAKSGVVKALQGEAPEAAKGQITAESDISSRLVIDIKQEIATIRTVTTTEGETKKDAIFTTILYKVEPIVKTVVTVTDGAGGETTEEVEATLPNEELKKNPLTFRLGIKDPQATGAYVRHIGHDEFEDETIFCKVQGPADGRYVELTVDHFSDFEVRTVDAVVVDTDDAVGIVNLGVPGAGMELAAAVPFLKSGVENGSKATLADLVVTGRENGDTIVFQKTGDESALSGDVWGDDEAQETGTAFWYKSVGSSVPLTLAGLVTDPVDTAVTAGSHEEPKATLLVNPYVSAQDVFAAVGGAAQDGDQVALVGGDVRYVRESGAWGYWKKSEYRANPEVADGGLFMSNEFVRVSSLTVPGGKGAWYVSKGGSPTVAWTAGVQTGAAEQIADAGLPTFGSVAWDVSLTGADMDAFAPEKVNLVAYDADGAKVGDYARPLVVDALGQHWTTFLGQDGYGWAGADVTAAAFAVELLDAAENVIASTEKVGFGDLLAEKALDVTYAGDVAPAVALTPYVFAGFSVSDNGEFASLADAFAGFGYVTKTAGGLTVTLTNDMEGVVTIADNLGSVTLDLNGFSITGTNGVNCAGGVALAVTGHITPDEGTAATQLLVKDRTGNGGKIVGGKGDRGAAGCVGGAAIVIADGVTVALATGDALPLVKGGDGGTGYVSAGGAAGYAVAKASGEKVPVVGTDDTAQPGEFWEAWAWCVCDTPAAEIPGTYYDGTKLWIHRREGNDRTGAAEFDFAVLKNLNVVGNAIHFLPGHFGVKSLAVGTNASDSLAFLGDDAGTVLYAMAGSSMFDVNRSGTQSVCWTNITFTSVEVPDEAYGGSGRAICQKGGSFEVSQCAFSNLVDDVDAVGGAIRAAFLAKDSRIVGSVFEGNEALTAEFDIDGEGGAVYASAKEGADVTLAVVDCTFTGNRSGNGGAICVWSGYEPGDGPISLAVTDSLFEGNAANYGGGAIFGNPTKLLVDAAATKDDLGETAFVGNAASWTGGAIDLNAYEGYMGRSAVTMRRGVRFVGNVASNETDFAVGGAIACWLSGGCDLVAEGVEFTGNLAFAPTQAIGGAMRFYENCAVTVDTCVFDDNDAVCTATSDYWCFGGAIESELGVTSIRNSTFRNSNVETVALWGGTAAVTNCVAVGNGETVGDYKYDDLYFENCSVDISYSAWGSVLFYADEPDACAFTGAFNLTNRTTDIYAGDDTLRLNPVGFNPVAALGVKQEAYDFVGVKYGSKDYGSSMGAYETPTERLYVNLNGDKTYDGTTSSNDVTWTWSYTTESGAPADWDDFVAADEFDTVFTLTNWVYGCKDHGFYATTNEAPRDIDAQIKGNDDVAQWYLDSGILKFVGTGTITRRPIELGGLEFTVDPDEYEWNNGEPVDATVTVVERIGDLEPLTLAEGTDYHLTCSENTDYTKKAVATVDLLHNWIGTTNDMYYITAYLVEYLFDDVVDASLTETYGKTSGVAVVVSEIPDPGAGYAFDRCNSPTNGVVRKFDEAGGVLRLKVCYYTDVDPADGTPDIYQRKVLAKVVNGGWSSGYRTDATLYVTMTNALGKWARAGSGIISYGPIPTGGSNALGGFSAGGWLALTSGGLVKVADPSNFTFDLGTVPFLVYAYSHGTTSGGTTHITRPGGGSGRPGSGSATQPAATDLLDQYKAVLSLTDATMAGNMFLIGTRIALKDVATGVDLVSAVPPGGKTLLKTAATPTGPWTDIEVDVDTAGKAQVPVDAESAFFKGGDL